MRLANDQMSSVCWNSARGGLLSAVAAWLVLFALILPALEAEPNQIQNGSASSFNFQTEGSEVNQRSPIYYSHD